MNPSSVICPDMDIGQHNAWLAHDFLALERLKCEIDFENDVEPESTYQDCFCDDIDPGICFYCGREN